MSINYNITLKEQPTHTSVKVSPSQKWLTDNKYSVDSSEYEEYTYTGTYEQILNQRDNALSGSSSEQVTTTITRLNGGLYQLQVRTSPLIKQEEEEEEEEISPEEKEHGSLTNPKQLSISTRWNNYF